MKWKMIVAMDENRLIGKDERLPWRIPEDIAWYQSQTDGKLLLMGRKTFEGIKRRPEGTNYIVLSQSLDPELHDTKTVTVINDIGEICSLPLQGEGWVCGGGTLYELMLPFCAEIILTEVKGSHEGDTYFPNFDAYYTYKETLLTHETFVVKRYVHKNYHEEAFDNYCLLNRIEHISTLEDE